ncbi:hypothetical protein PL11_003495 [Lentilactobacillus curieae]|uniref:Peptidase M10 metallopeptidase domain-containing protein n=1 Tax=Lentilactobacillus curieae TaxID=1138822 RepID=A0A1S6QHH8_9LACO|nr:matrixin family metalloprotease [Lentilactobacillus curieae]AQW21049.1 hypothetical protein PL11_003495 [Lentilactobacillus curieae]
MTTKLNLRIKLLMISVLSLTLFAFPTSSNVHASSVKPSATMLKKTKTYYRSHAKTIAKKYRITYSLQTALTKNGHAKIYVATKNKTLRSSIKLAVNYWNQKLGKKVITYGTKRSHTLTFSVSKEPITSGVDTGDAWWIPKLKKMQVRDYYYKLSVSGIRNEMLKKSLSQFSAVANRKIVAYANQIGKSDPDYYSKVEHYRQQQIDYVQKQLEEVQSSIDKNGTAYKARKFQYANIITHEFGHVFGLEHSPNKTDVMYWSSQRPEIFDYQKVAKSKNGFNPITQTDLMRTKLALNMKKAGV